LEHGIGKAQFAIGFREGARKWKMSFNSGIKVKMAMELAETALRY
jgi:hypothetical protein